MRLIDADRLQKQFDEKSTNPNYRVNMHNIKSIISNAPTVEAIPKADYEARLKADMVAMLTEILLKAEENTVRWYVGRVDGKSDDVVLMETLQEIIQQKIDALKGGEDEMP